MKPSAQFSWNKADTIKFAQEAVKVLAPYLIVIIPVLIGQVPQDWAYAAVTIYILNRIRSAVMLYIAGK